jgi:hypothetical protein
LPESQDWGKQEAEEEDVQGLETAVLVMEASKVSQGIQEGK